MLSKLTVERWCDFATEGLIYFLIFFPPFFHGSVTILPLSIIEITSFFLLLVFWGRLCLKDTISLVKFPIVFALIFLGVVLFQLLDLPKGLLSFFSPATSSLYTDFKISPYFSTLSICPELTEKYLILVLTYFVVFFVVLNYIDSERKIRRISLVIIACGILYSLLGIMRIDLSLSSAGFSTFTNRDHFAAYIEIIAFLCLGFSLTHLPRSGRIILIFLSSVFIIIIFLTASRAARLCSLLSLFIFLFFIKAKKPNKKIIIVPLILFLFLGFFFLLIGLGPLLARMDTLLQPFKAYSARFEFLKDSLRVFLDFPLLGTGLGTFSEIAQKYKSTDWQISYAFSHNEPVQLLTEVGILGFSLIIFFLFGYLREIFSVWFRRKSSFAVFLSLGCLLGILSIMLHSFFEFMLHVPAVGFLFFVILALSYRAVYIKEQQNLLAIPKVEFSLNRYSKIMFFLVFCAGIFFLESLIFKRYFSEAIFLKIDKQEFSKDDMEAIFDYKKALRNIDRAIVFNPLKSQCLNKKGDLLSELAMREGLEVALSDIGPFKRREEALLLAEGCYKEAINLNPAKADYHLRLGWLYSIMGNNLLMEKEFAKSISLDPRNQKIKDYVEKYSNVSSKRYSIDQ